MIYVLFLCLYFAWLAVQNFLLPLAFQQGWLSFTVVGALMAAKEAVMVSSLLLLGYRAFKKGWRLNIADKFALAYSLLLLLYLAFAPFMMGSTVSFFIRLISLRYLIALAAFYFWGRLSFLEVRELRRLVVFVLALQGAVALFGIVEWSVVPLSFWRDTVGVGAFMTDVKGLPEGVTSLMVSPSTWCDLRSGALSRPMEILWPWRSRASFLSYCAQHGCCIRKQPTPSRIGAIGGLPCQSSALACC